MLLRGLLDRLLMVLLLGRRAVLLLRGRRAVALATVFIGNTTPQRRGHRRGPVTLKMGNEQWGRREEQRSS